MNHTLTLTRWHKVAERINAALRERQDQVVGWLTAAAISPWNKEGVEQKAGAMLAEGKVYVAQIELGTQTVARIRSALAQRNAELGVAAKLAEVEAANRRIALYRAVLEKQTVDMVRPENVRHVPAYAGAEEAPAWGRRDAARITLQVADRELLAGMRAKLAAEQARSHAMLDEISDLNREKLQLEVPQELVQIAGLAES